MRPHFQIALREILERQSTPQVRLDEIEGLIPRLGHLDDRLFYRIGLNEIPSSRAEDLRAVQTAAEEQGVMSRQVEMDGCALLEFQIAAAPRALATAQSRLVAAVNAAWGAAMRLEELRFPNPLDEASFRKELRRMVKIDGSMGKHPRLNIEPTAIELWTESKVSKGSAQEAALRDAAEAAGLESGLAAEGDHMLLYLTARYFDEAGWQQAARKLLLFVEHHRDALQAN